MKNSHLIGVLQTLNKKEVREFKKWLASPLHNQREDVEDLFSYLMAGNHLSDEKYQEKEKIYKKIFPKAPFDDAKFRQTMFFLNKALEEFLIYSRYNGDTLQSQIILAQIYRERNLDKQFLKLTKNIEKTKEKSTVRDAVYFSKEHQLEFELYEHMLTQGRTAELNYLEMSEALDKAYIIRKLKLLCYVTTHKAIYQQYQYPIEMADEIIQLVKERGLIDEPAIGIYYHIYQAMNFPEDESHYKQFKAQLENCGHVFEGRELNQIILLGLSYCTEMLNAGKKNYSKEAFIMQQMGIERRLFLENGILKTDVYRNIVINGCLQREFDWVSNFIETNKELLPADKREVTAHYCESILYFLKKDYNRARILLMQFKYNDPLLTLQTKSMLIRLYYEEDEIDFLENELENTRSYLHRHKGEVQKLERMSRFLKYTKKMIRLHPSNKEAKEKLVQEVKEAKPFGEKRWLLEQLSLL
ncbi:MAG: hypothetical protein AAFO07_19215 [Bacteroidota bacterium]